MEVNRVAPQLTTKSTVNSAEQSSDTQSSTEGQA